MPEDEVDMVNHPPHYTSHPSGAECIDIIEHLPANVANAVKYCWRCDDKHESPLEDLNKARWYINREIERIEQRGRPRLIKNVREALTEALAKFEKDDS